MLCGMELSQLHTARVMNAAQKIHKKMMKDTYDAL